MAYNWVYQQNVPFFSNTQIVSNDTIQNGQHFGTSGCLDCVLMGINVDQY